MDTEDGRIDGTMTGDAEFDGKGTNDAAIGLTEADGMEEVDGNADADGIIEGKTEGVEQALAQSTEIEALPVTLGFDRH